MACTLHDVIDNDMMDMRSDDDDDDDDGDEATTMLNGSAVSGAEPPHRPPAVQRSCGVHRAQIARVGMHNRQHHLKNTCMG